MEMDVGYRMVFIDEVYDLQVRYMKKIAIVTGASSGMGREFVKQLNKCTRTLDEVWVIARREERLIALQKEICMFPLRILPLDLCNENNLMELSELLECEKPVVRLLVNAAGVGKEGRFDCLTRQEAENMVLLNDKALVSVTRLVLPYMKKPGSIIQLASASAFLPQKDFAVYAASKSFVFSFSRALNAELKQKGITVTAVCPGPVNTEFLTISNAGKGQKPLKKLVTVKPGPVVAKALRDAKAGKAVSVYGLPMKTVHVLSKLVPNGLFLK